MPRVARNFRFFADQLLTLGDARRRHDGFAEHFEWDPSGVTAVITPWNAPLMLATWRVAPALAAGNAVVLKPPEWAPLTASLLADIAHDAGLPDGAFNVRAGDRRGSGRRAHRPSRHRPHRVHRLGADRQARRAGRGARTSRRRRLELGGKSPFVAFADADLDAVVAQAVEPVRQRRPGLPGRHAAARGGVDPRRVPRPVHPSAAAAIAQGDPREEATDIGPQITREHFERVDGFVQRAKADGARAVFGGGPERGARAACTTGRRCSPTPRRDREILTQEVFGPVLTAPDVRRRGRGGRAGERHATTAWPRSCTRAIPARAERVSRAARRRHRVGQLLLRARPGAPRSAARATPGIGREGGTWSFDFYSDVKNVCTAPWTT